MIRAIIIGLVTAAVTFTLCMATMRFPPPAIMIATGPAGGAYQTAGEAYREELARHGVEVRLVPSGGSPANLRLLHDHKSGVVAALVQGGIMSVADQYDLESLGTLFYEPMLLFVRDEACAPVCGMAEFMAELHRRVSIGGPDSGTQVLAKAILRALGATEAWQELPTPEARDALLAGTLDAAFVVAAWGSPNVETLLRDPAIRLMDYPVADALIGVSPALHHVVLPRGARSFAMDLPPRNIDLVAPKASLVVRRDLHPAIQRLLLEAMRRIHSKPAMFTHSNEFPAAEAIGLRLSDTAQQFYAHSEPFYVRFLPYSIADQIAASIAILIPVWALLYKPLAQLLARRRSIRTNAPDPRVPPQNQSHT